MATIDLLSWKPEAETLPEAEPEPEAGGFWDGADVISSYSRAQAIEDGELVDVTETAREAGITFPVAITRAAWLDCVEWSAADSARQTHQDESGRLWDVLRMLRFAIRLGRVTGNRGTFSLIRVPRGGRGHVARKVTLQSICGPGDDAAPVITISMLGES